MLQDARELVISRLSKVVGEALTRMGEELSGQALKSKVADEQRALMDAVTVVRQHRTEIELRFRRAFTDVFERRLLRPDEQADDEHTGSGELALVDEAELEAKLEVDRLVNRARGQLDPDEVLGVRARLAALLDREWFDEVRHPASPEAVFEALKRALHDLAPKPDVQTALLDAFEPHVTANLNAVYATVNERLRAGDVLPKLRLQVEGGGGAARSPAGLSPTDPTASALEQLVGGFASGGQQGAQGSQGPAASEIRAVLAQLSSGSRGGRENATRMLANPDLYALADLPIPAAQAPLIDELSALQANTALSPAIPSQVLADLNARALEKGSPLDQLTVEIVSMVFDYIYADKRLADAVKQQLLRLQVVAIKAALIDRSFFARRAHPMRRLIERITKVGADADADLSAASPLVSGVEKVVEWVLLDFHEDLKTFDEARARIDALAADESGRRSERIAQVTRVAEHKEAVLHARGLAMARLSDRLDPDTAEFVRRFLEEWWSTVLAEAQITGASAALQFDEAMSIGEALIWSVAPKVPEEVQRLASMLPKLIGGLMRGAKMVAMPDNLREAFFNDLLQAHTRAIEAAKQPGSSSRGQTNLRMRSDGRIQFTPVIAPPDAARVDTQAFEVSSPALAELRRGDTIEIDTAGDGEFDVFKLAWISPAQRLYILSRFPEGAMQVERDQLAAMFDAGRARLAERGSALDRAIESVSSEPTSAAAPKGKARPG